MFNQTKASAVQPGRKSVFRSTRSAGAIRGSEDGRHLCATATQTFVEPAERSDSGGWFDTVIGFSLSFALLVSGLAVVAHIWANAGMTMIR